MIDDFHVHNIIAIAPFDQTTNQIIADEIITDELFQQSYLCKILKTVDTTLNDVMQKILEKYSLSHFHDFK